MASKNSGSSESAENFSFLNVAKTEEEEPAWKKTYARMIQRRKEEEEAVKGAKRGEDGELST